MKLLLELLSARLRNKPRILGKNCLSISKVRMLSKNSQLDNQKLKACDKGVIFEIAWVDGLRKINVIKVKYSLKQTVLGKKERFV